MTTRGLGTLVAGLMCLPALACRSAEAPATTATDAPSGASGTPVVAAAAATLDGAAADAAGGGSLHRPGADIGPGSICESDGWCWWDPLPSGTWWRAVAGAGASDVWIGGQSHIALRFDGTTWTTVTTPLSLVQGIWAAAANDVWLGGTSGAGVAAIAHWDGTAVTLIAEFGPGEIDDVWGSGANDVYAVGFANAQHWDGQAWTTVPGGVRGTSVSGSKTDDVWIGSSDGLWRFDGAAWTRVPEVEGRFVQGVTVPARNDVWAAVLHDGVVDIQHFDGAAWTVSFHIDDRNVNVWGIGSGSKRDVWVLGTHWSSFVQRGYAAHFDGQAWAVAPDAPTSLFRMNRIAGRGDLAVGMNGGIVRLTHPDSGPGWNDLRTGPAETLSGVWGTASDRDMWAVGAAGTALRWNGSRVRAVPAGVTVDLTDVWGTGRRDVWAVGAAGTALHFDGSAWTAVPTGTSANLQAVFTAAAGDVWAGGDGGTLLHGNGSSFQPVALPGAGAGEQILDIHGIAANDVWLSGMASNGGFVAHFDGTAWSPIEVLNTDAGGYPARRIWQLAANDVWMLTQPVFRNFVDYWHFDGTAWTERFMEPSPETWMFPKPGQGGSFAFGPGDVWFVGALGTWQRNTTGAAP